MKRILISIGTLALVAAILLGLNFGLAGVREKNTQKELNQMLLTLLPGSTSFSEEAHTSAEGDLVEKVYKAENGFVILTRTQGYGGDLAMLVGVSLEGSVTGVVVRDLSETMGLGSKALTDDTFLAQLLWTEGEAAVGENVDALTGATVTSKAVTRCVNAAVSYVTGADTSSGATSWGG